MPLMSNPADRRSPQIADQGWLDALKRRDTVAVVDFLHPDYALVLVHPSTVTVHRDEWLRTLPGYVISGWEVRGESWDLRDDLALHLHLVNMDAAVFGADRSGDYRCRGSGHNGGAGRAAATEEAREESLAVGIEEAGGQESHTEGGGDESRSAEAGS